MVKISTNPFSKELKKNAESEEKFIDKNELDYLLVNNKRLKQASKRLNKELTRVKVEFKQDKDDAILDLKGKIKQWRKSLGKERSEKIKLEKKLVQPIPNYILVVFFGILADQIMVMLVVKKKMMKKQRAGTIRKTSMMMRIFHLITMEVMEK